MVTETEFMADAFYISNESCVFTFDGCTLQWRDNIVPVTEILVVDYVHCNGCCRKGSAMSPGRMFFRKLSRSLQHDTIVIHYAQWQKKNRLRKRHVKFKGDSERLAVWLTALQTSLSDVSADRPKRCLVFINPYSGRQNGVDLYMTKVKPLLSVAGVGTCEVVTRNRDDFEKVICSGIDCYDSILAVGGDGTVSDIVNSLIISAMDRTEACVPEVRIPVGIVPCGSTDCIAYTLNGTRDTETNVLHVILGNRFRFDVCRAVSENKYRFFLSVFTYGYLSDLVIESEKFRWMGPIRYNYAGLLTLLRMKEYLCQLDITGRLITRKSVLPAGLCFQTDVCAGQHHSVCGKYFLVACANISCASELTPNGLAPECAPGDGSMNIVLLHPKTFCDLYKIYLRLTSKDRTALLSDLPCVTVYTAERVKISVNQGGQKLSANCDGELFHDSAVDIGIHKGIVQIFARRQPELAVSKISPKASKS